ncbi:sensor histidine kinase [Streptomyces sp. NPDC050504]|uniref:sensor histidine kinase n=1 Tax=Streptomyces sp. NPDC050504 TaxID=3365618 RepID=UPI0037AC6E72
MPHVPAPLALRTAVRAVRLRVDRWAGEPRALDVLTAVSCFALMGLDIPGLARADNSLTGITATLTLAVGSATLLVRRAVPWVPYLVALVFLGWLHELTLIQFALYSLGRYRGRTAGSVATVLYVAVAYGFYLTPGWPPHRGESLSDFLSLVVPIGVLAAGVGIAANRQDLVRELAAQRAETVALQAVQDERVSVARDVHDFVGRELSGLAISAEVLVRRARGTAGERDLEELAETARRAHLMLNETIVQRGSGSTPGLEGLDELAERNERMGSPVDLKVDDAAYGLSPLRQAAVHRVVQECLTNAAKHAPGERVSVSIAVDGGHLRIEARNALPRAAPPHVPVSSGTGMLSMRERVESQRGTLLAGAADGVYVVVATLPTGLP